jgi:hypothetical protein
MEFAKDAKALIASVIALLPLDASVVGVTTDPTKVTLNINSRGSRQGLVRLDLDSGAASPQHEGPSVHQSWSVQGN